MTSGGVKLVNHFDYLWLFLFMNVCSLGTSGAA